MTSALMDVDIASAPGCVPTTIQADDSVLIRMPSGNTKIITVKPDTTIALGKFGSFNSTELLGRTFGSTYEIQKSGRIVPHKQASFDNADDTEANNREINDNSGSQKLSHEEIEKLKLKGLSGDVSSKEIISSLMENNATFEKKTEYSKSKYIRRKERKFMKTFTPLETTVHNLCTYFFTNNPLKIRALRVDTLSQIMSLANVYSGARVLAVDDGQGLVVGSILSRIGNGLVFAIHDGDTSNYDVLRYMNNKETQKLHLRSLPWHKIHTTIEPFTEELPENPSEVAIKGRERRLNAHAKLSENLEIFRKGDFDALVVSSNYDPMSVVRELVTYVGGSRMVVVYSPHEEPLLAAFNWMRESRYFINVQITESWLREYQVLPNRTHPLMSMSGSGGFILSAIRIIPSE